MDQTKPDYQSVLSQLAGAIVGRGIIYFISIGSLLAILCLSANTSFVDFPRLCRLVARDCHRMSSPVHLRKLEGPDAEEHVGRLQRQWRDDVERPARSTGLKPPQLIISPSPYRSFAGRLLKHVSEIEAQHPGRPILVVIPEIMKGHWWDYVLLDSSRMRKLRTALLRHGGPDLAVVTVPWAREEPHPEEVIKGAAIRGAGNSYSGTRLRPGAAIRVSRSLAVE